MEWGIEVKSYYDIHKSNIVLYNNDKLVDHSLENRQKFYELEI